MIAKVNAFTLQGLDALPVEVEAGVYNGLPDFTIVGLPDAVLRESRERVRSAVVNAGYQWPVRRMLVNLAPAHIRKEGSGLDLAVGVSLLKASGQLPGLDTNAIVFTGELSLDGSLRGTRGVLAAALSMDRWPDKILAVPAANREEALRGTGRVLAIDSLEQLSDGVLMKRKMLEAMTGSVLAGEDDEDAVNTTNVVGVTHAADVGAGYGNSAHSFSDDAALFYELSMVRGQNKAKRALELAAAGGHHLLLIGPPGSGKSLLARCLQGILPPMTREETLEVNRVYSAAGLLNQENPWISKRPFRSPHAGITKAGLLGGGMPFRPGEISLAHHGVLFIDELPEMDRNCLESLRQPLEEGQVTLSRAWGSITMPAHIQLVASANPCPCGYYGEYPPKCKCLDHEIRRYQNRFSGPLMDRVDMVVQAPRPDAESLTNEKPEGESSYMIARRVAEVWQRRKQRERSESSNLESLRKQLTTKSKKWAVLAYDKHQLSARGYYRMLLLARTIADMNGEDAIGVSALAEALEYRPGAAAG